MLLDGTQMLPVATGPLSLQVQQPEGRLWALDAPASGSDLAGATVPAGAVRRRLLVAGDGRRYLWVAERFQLPNCGHQERVHLLDTVDRKVTTLHRGGELNLRVGFGAGRFHWVAGLPAGGAPEDDPTTLKF